MINAVRSVEAPPSLAACKKYNAQDVVDALLRDFLNKCYLCETRISLRKQSVDHRRSKELFPELKFAWENLCPACRDCNDRRPKPRVRSIADRILNPTCDDVEARIHQTLRYDETCNAEIPCFSARDPADDRAVATAKELEHLHNDRKSMKAAELRAAITRRIDEVLVRVRDLQKYGNATRGPVRAAWEAPLRHDFSRRAPFTALVRGRLGAGLEHLFDGPASAHSLSGGSDPQNNSSS